MSNTILSIIFLDQFDAIKSLDQIDLIIIYDS